VVQEYLRPQEGEEGEYRRQVERGYPRPRKRSPTGRPGDLEVQVVLESPRPAAHQADPEARTEQHPSAALQADREARTERHPSAALQADREARTERHPSVALQADPGARTERHPSAALQVGREVPHRKVVARVVLRRRPSAAHSGADPQAVAREARHPLTERPVDRVLSAEDRPQEDRVAPAEDLPQEDRVAPAEDLQQGDRVAPAEDRPPEVRGVPSRPAAQSDLRVAHRREIPVQARARAAVRLYRFRRHRRRSQALQAVVRSPTPRGRLGGRRLPLRRCPPWSR
jgi:hypothetical protein